MKDVKPEETKLACDDCGDPVPPGRRRRKCKHCGMKVCPWCMGHVHARANKVTS